MSRGASSVNHWNSAALACFRKSVCAKHDPDEMGGKPWGVFSKGLQNVDATLLPAGKLKRREVLNIASDPCVNIETVCLAIMAWGGMWIRSRKLLFNSKNTEWFRVATEIRAGQLSRQCAYKELRNLRENGELKGAGPAFFTKLIYFLSPRSSHGEKPAYIMDQWAGCAVNLLKGDNVVLMDVVKTWQIDKSKPFASSVYRVSDANTEKNYENFCKEVDRLAKYFSLNTDEVDRALVGSGGKKPSPWRQYIINNRVP